jgi:AbrB family looped-hinge helix DNA binding protein
MTAEPEITTLGEKGQVVIPQSLRNELGMKPKTKFIVFGQGDVIVLKRLTLPDVQREWAGIFAAADAKGPAPAPDEVEKEVASARRARRSKKG